MSSDRAKVSLLLKDAWPELDQESHDRVVCFWEVLVDENTRQNLTRLTSPEQFVEGHVLDVRELVRWGQLEFPAMDLGSGCGVPGLLAAAVGVGPWVLAESEGQKAAFLARAADVLGIQDRVEVFSGRGEVLLRSRKVGSVVTRAVGTVEKIYGWVGECSTWNSLVLFKGPSWTEEWANFGKSRHRGRLKVFAELNYEVGPEKKTRKLVRLSRVPRGTSTS